MTIEAISTHRNATIEETGISTKTTMSTELATTARSSEAMAEIQGAIIIAQRFPRNEDVAFEKLMRSSKRPSFADKARYSFPRGGSNVSGPSVNLAREAARVWGNVRYGLEILRDDEDERHIRAWSWDLETNTKVIAEDSFRKLIQRKRGGQTKWVVPDERDLRELTNKLGAILVRNCILQILPRDLIEDAENQCIETKRNRAQADPDGERKKIISGFSTINVTPSMLEEYLGHPVGQCSPDEIVSLREVYQSIRDQNSKWSEYVTKEESKPNGEPSITVADIIPEKTEEASATKPKLLPVSKRKAFQKRIAENSAMLPADVYAEIEERFDVPFLDLTADRADELAAFLDEKGI